MATLSTLELMLEEIQRKDEAKEADSPPALPSRPVSKARTPPRRGRRAISPFHLQEVVGLEGLGGKKEDVVNYMSKRTRREAFECVEEGNQCQENGEISANLKFGNMAMQESHFRDNVGGPALSEIKNGIEEGAVKGIIGIQKCFRGYRARCNYHQLKERIIALQSFVRGENARRKFEQLGKTQTSFLLIKQVKQKIVWKTLRNRETAIVYLQSVIRGWLSRRHLHYNGYTKTLTAGSTNHANRPGKNNLENKDHIAVPYSYILDLEQRVLKTEAALRNKKEENDALQRQIQQIDIKWQSYEAKMKSMEKTWQDEFASIQESLATVREKRTKEITNLPQDAAVQEVSGRRNYTIKHILERQDLGMDDTDSSFREEDYLGYVLDSRRYPKEELRKLKSQFKTWKKEFNARLSEIKETIDRLDQSKAKRNRKSWCVR